MTYSKGGALWPLYQVEIKEEGFGILCKGARSPEDMGFSCEIQSTLLWLLANWEAANSFGYLGGKAKKGDKPLYVWLVDGVGIYKNFPVDFDGGAPDEIIPNEKVTPAIAKKAVLQMYKLQNE